MVRVGIRVRVRVRVRFRGTTRLRTEDTEAEDKKASCTTSLTSEK